MEAIYKPDTMEGFRHKPLLSSVTVLTKLCCLTLLCSMLTACEWVTSNSYLFTLTSYEKTMLIEMFPEDAETIEEGRLNAAQQQAWQAHRNGSDTIHRKYSMLNPEFTGFSKVSDNSYVGTFIIDGVSYEYTVIVTEDDIVVEDNYTYKEVTENALEDM